MAKVYLSKDITEASVKRLAKEFAGTLGGRTAVKVHFGEKGNTRFVSPDFVKAITDEFKGLDMFVTDTNTLYPGMRYKASLHLDVAKQHGFERVGLPLVIADGEDGSDEADVPVNGGVFDSVKIGKAIADAGSILCISHVKGHVLFGFGGALKNLGMGCGSRAGKLAMHSKVSPVVGDECNGCGVCKENCIHEAIDMVEGKAVINENCVGCARCIAVCPTKAMKVPWHGATSSEAMERTADYVIGALKGKKALHFNFIMNVTKDCDCLGDSRIIADDVGVAVSTDPVALDQACYDLLIKANGRDVFKDVNRVDGSHIMDVCEKLGVGTKSYELIEV